MIEFNKEDPFPSVKTIDLNSERAHAALVDRWLGLNTSLTVDKREDGHENWAKVDVGHIQTPYTEIRSVLDYLNPQPGQTFVDLGCAFGRVGFVLARHYPEVFFKGYEIEPIRANEARRCLDAFSPGGKHEIFCQNITSPEFSIPVADYYFIYEYGSEADIENTISKIEKFTHDFLVIAHWIKPWKTPSRFPGLGTMPWRYYNIYYPKKRGSLIMGPHFIR